MAKKLIALLLAVLMLAGMLAGCAKTAETPAPAAEDPADTSDSSSTTDTLTRNPRIPLIPIRLQPARSWKKRSASRSTGSTGAAKKPPIRRSSIWLWPPALLPISS